MAIAWRSGADGVEFGGSTSVVCNKPSGVASGDALVAAVTIFDNPAGDVTTPPSGWTLISAGSVAVGNIVQRIYIKVAGGSEPSSYTWVINNLDVCTIAIGAWTGADTTTPQDATATGNSGTGANRSATGLTTATAGAVIVLLTSGYAQTISAVPSGMTTRYTYNTRQYIIDQTIASAGATGSKTATSSADANGWTTCLVALRPASVAADRPKAVLAVTPLYPYQLEV